MAKLSFLSSFSFDFQNLGSKGYYIIILILHVKQLQHQKKKSAQKTKQKKSLSFSTSFFI